MIVLGIESSCDDTAAAVLQDDEVLSSVVSSQLVHAGYGGIVPELASRDHQRAIVPVVEEALTRADKKLQDLDGIAVTYGPGLAGSLLVGLSYAKGLALGLGRPLIGVNHLEGHLYSVFLSEGKPQFPYLTLIVSGGHTQTVWMEESMAHRTIGRTRDDAAGEAYDKVGKLLGLPFPGGPEIDRLAAEGDPKFVRFPHGRPDAFNFSFSGIKTNVLYYLNGHREAEREVLLREHLADICASFQAAMVRMLIDGLLAAVQETGAGQVAITGGVSANLGLRRAATAAAEKHGFRLYLPPLRYCMDNAAMIAIAGLHKLRSGIQSPLTLTAQPALPL